jgi:hypothetical protein
MARDLSRDEILALASHAGLDLPPAYQDQLVAAYADVARMIRSIPRTRPHADEPAHVFNPLSFLPGKA